ncbi:choice-of-anchor D domain-containing protein [Kribbella sp. VKM Ac-2566]|uniref:choice-of-anchor D domain-containing protein n=1 Tax=Kribbella sp. VKM Ac-2566 TaxID=2512218 RepID=UPI001062E30E|nr:choice-of-anchor D domain-containing protein [Kribbella sp. VKM Ac-2566]TDW98832.1 WD40 repeat protein [Kribbella sp. VKM Ac-2566]
MHRALKPALAAALAAITLPFIAHTAFGDEATTTPTAQVFPTRQGIGVTWNSVGASSYRVERQQAGADWAQVSGPLGASTVSWVDDYLGIGETASYRVVATTDDEAATSSAVTATRSTETPAVGDVDVLSLDAEPGTTWLDDETADAVTASAPAGGSRTLAAGTVKVRLPAFITGPGNYSLTPSELELTQGDHSCTANGYLSVRAVAYTAALELDTLSASLRVTGCAGTAGINTVELRYHSTFGYQALSVTPEKYDYGKVRYNVASSAPFTVKNTGTDPVQITGITVANELIEWRQDPAAPHDCPSTLAPAASCTVSVRFMPQTPGPKSTTLTIQDTTASGRHIVTLTGYGVDVAAAQNVAVRSTYNGHTVSWRSLQTAGGTAVLGYNLHKYLNGVETVEWFPVKASTDDFVVVRSSTEPGTEYAVSLVNEVGEGPVSTRLPVPRAIEQVVITQGEPDSRDLVAADEFGNVVPFPADPNSVRPKEAVTSSPDGRSLAYVSGTTERALWTQTVTPGVLGVPVKLWSSTAPITHLSWSPDGTRIAFQAPENTTPCVYLIAATGGTPTKVACQVSSPSWMPDARTLVVSDHRLTPSRLATIAATAGGTRISTLPGDAEVADGRPVRASADGRYVAFGDGSTVRLAGMTERRSPSLDSEVRAIAWAGARILALTAGGRVYELGMDGGDLYMYNGLARETNTNRTDLTWQHPGVTIKPTPAVMGPNISVPFDSSAFAAGTRFYCKVEGSFEPEEPCTSPFTGTELRSGNYQVIVRASTPDGSGAAGWRNITVDADGPVARMVTPAYQSSVAATATLTVSATDPNGIASYDVQYRRATSAGPYGDPVQPWTNTTATSMNLAVAAGYEYCVSVRAKDKLGNIGQWSTQRCFSRPLDDRSMSLATTGWTRATGSTFYYGTTTQTTAYGKALTRTVQGKRFFLVATRCPTCGSVAVYAGNRYLTTVNLAYPTTHKQVLLGLPVQSTLFSGTLKLVSASSGKLVQIDGLAVGRS